MEFRTLTLIVTSTAQYIESSIDDSMTSRTSWDFPRKKLPSEKNKVKEKYSVEVCDFFTKLHLKETKRSLLTF